LEVWSVPLRHRVPTAGFHFKEKQPGLNVEKFKIEKYNLSIAQIVAAKRGEDVELESGEVIPNAELTYTPYKARSYAYLSDTNYSAKAAERVHGVDLLYHEATYAQSEEQWAKGRGHSTTIEAAKVAVKAEAKRLIIGHFSSRYKNHEALVEECRTIFANTDLANEGETFHIEEQR
jgi:ribonuclease Z